MLALSWRPLGATPLVEAWCNVHQVCCACCPVPAGPPPNPIMVQQFHWFLFWRGFIVWQNQLLDPLGGEKGATWNDWDGLKIFQSQDLSVYCLAQQVYIRHVLTWWWLAAQLFGNIGRADLIISIVCAGNDPLRKDETKAAETKRGGWGRRGVEGPTRPGAEKSERGTPGYIWTGRLDKSWGPGFGFWFCELLRRACQRAQSRVVPIMTNWWWVQNFCLIFSDFLWSHVKSVSVRIFAKQYHPEAWTFVSINNQYIHLGQGSLKITQKDSIMPLLMAVLLEF